MTPPPADDSAGDAEATARLGASIRRLRHARAKTLVQLAEATGLSHPFLSQLERGLAQPSLSSLRRIAVALQTSPIELIAAADAPGPTSGRIEVHRRGEGRVDESFGPGDARMLAHGSRPLHPLELEGSNAAPGEVFTHREDEFLYVAEGDVRVDLGDREVRLAVGDSVYYVGGVPHRWWSATGRPYRLVVVKQGTSVPGEDG
ncbi:MULTISPECIES: helix-turn-helix domain-containing protein [Microbacterium]|uniref:XRE family transcriptional regulator n=1 Tax=Microbacterium wangchenii TaxID=2541726 RepID=A0ABX5SMH4_9MICO|nr:MULTISPECIES: cupin domain-containing protein [Microbacterium]MCK6066346.1 cupin domain-containing protein [Microbacterium sp. EYE_512]QBR87316.1 XRE family transcriptional regulator [Microbacterium wangchenii]TFV84581.1 XRE family transcriptional regulator [Microbacterium sp. dk485]TXK14637.1 cupin domain-containing protein [Microbacterium wangchenii]